MRKIIYIGQGCQQSVYYNTKTREALTTQSSASSETDGAISSKKSKWPWVVFFAFLLVTIIGIWIRSLIAPFKLSEWMVPIHLAAILFVFIGSVYGFEKLFYSGAKSLVPASEEQFKDAVESSTFWRKSPDRNQQSIKSSCIYLLSSFFYLFLLLLCSLPYLGPSFPTMNMNGLNRRCSWCQSEQRSSQLAWFFYYFKTIQSAGC